MAWKKIIHSGSNAHLKNLGVGYTPGDDANGSGIISASRGVTATTVEGTTSGDIDKIVVWNASTYEYQTIQSSEVTRASNTLTIDTGSSVNPGGFDSVRTSGGAGDNKYDTSVGLTISIDEVALSGNGLNGDTSNKLTVTAGDNITVGANGLSVSSTIIASSPATPQGLEYDEVNDDIGFIVDGSTIAVNTGQLAVVTAGVKDFDAQLDGGGGFTAFRYSGSQATEISLNLSGLAGEGLVAQGSALRISTGSDALVTNKVLKYDQGGEKFQTSSITDDTDANTINISNPTAGGAAIQVNVPSATANGFRVTGTSNFSHQDSFSIVDKFVVINGNASAAATDAFGFQGQQSSTAQVGWSFNGGADTNTTRRWGLSNGGNLPAGQLGTFQGGQILVVGTNIAEATADAFNNGALTNKKGNLTTSDDGSIRVYVG